MKLATLGAVTLFLSLTCSAQQETLHLDATKAEWTNEGASVQVPELNETHITTGSMDGRWFTSVRVAAGNAAGLQFLIEDLTLPEGAKLLLLQPSLSGAEEMLRGVYEGSGPLDGGAFWTDSVAGPEAILRVLYEGEASSALPFRLAGARQLTVDGLKALARVTVFERPEVEGVTGVTTFRGRNVPFVVNGGIAMAEGDIMLGSIDFIDLVGSKNPNRDSMGITSTAYRWANGIVPYIIDGVLPNQARVTSAVAHWNTTLAGVIRMVPRTNEPYYVKFTYSSNAGLCSSYIGMIRQAGQPVNIGDYCSAGNIVHEIGHAVGLFHEHTREDRNNYVQIRYANITASAVSNFDQAISISDDLGAYDYDSIMHYPSTAFSSNGQPTIVTIPAGIPIGQRSTLSAGDIAGVRKMYAVSVTPAPNPGTVQVTISSNPVGRTLIVDGATVTAPAVFTWTPGGAHSVSAPSAIGATSKFTFTSWSDGGAQTHNYTSPSTAATLTATFTAGYKVTAASSNTTLGTVNVTPASADSFYAQGTAVRIAATNVGSGCLASWTGVTAPPSSPLQLSATQAYSITANFQTGAVTLPYTGISAGWQGGSGSLPVNSSTGCSWTASTTLNWIQILQGAGTGSGYVRLSVAVNNSPNMRAGIVNIGNATIQVIQYGR